MSYSFSVKASTKDEAKQKIAEQFDKVVEGQPSHADDKAAALATANAFIDLLTDVPKDHHVSVSINGSLSWNHDAPNKYVGASVGVNAGFVDNRWL